MKGNLLEFKKQHYFHFNSTLYPLNCSEMEQIDLHSIASDKQDTGAVPTGTGAPTKRKYIVALLVLLFGLGSWFGVTTIFSQMPIIIASAPEGWMLPWCLSITVQFGNAVSLLYVYAHKLCARKLHDAHAICMLMAIGCVAAICMPFTYRLTLGNVSIALHIFTFIFATIGGFSTMLFMPYVKRFRGNYLFVFFFGQALNDVLSNAFAALQGMWGSSECVVGESILTQFIRHTKSPIFNPKIAFLLVFPMLATSTAAFILLNKKKLCRDELSVDTEPIDLDTRRHCDTTDQNNVSTPVQHAHQLKFYHLMLSNVLFAIAATGIFPFIHSFTCQSYARSPISYNLAIALIAIYHPLIWFVATLLPHQCMRLVRVCKPRVIILVSYLLFYVFYSFILWTWNSLLALILLVNLWPFLIENSSFYNSFFPTVRDLDDIHRQHHFHEINNIDCIPLSKRQIHRSARWEWFKSGHAGNNLIFIRRFCLSEAFDDMLLFGVCGRFNVLSYTKCVVRICLMFSVFSIYVQFIEWKCQNDIFHKNCAQINMQPTSHRNRIALFFIRTK